MVEFSEPKIVWVDSWRDLPRDVEIKVLDPMTRAQYSYPENVIYAVKGKAAKYDIAHEKYHAIKTQREMSGKLKLSPEKAVKEILAEEWESKKRNPQKTLNDCVAEEFEAHKYAYEETGKPQHLTRQLNGMFVWLAEDEEVKPEEKGKIIVIDVKPSKAMALLHKHLQAVKPPQEWLDDFKEVEKNYHEQYREYKDDPSSVFYGDVEYQSNSNLGQLRVEHKPKNTKDWWEDKYYQNKPLSTTHGRGKRNYGKGSLLSADLSGKL